MAICKHREEGGGCLIAMKVFGKIYGVIKESRKSGEKYNYDMSCKPEICTNSANKYKWGKKWMKILIGV